MNIKLNGYKIDTLNSTEYKILSINKCCDKILRSAAINLHNEPTDSQENIYKPMVAILYRDIVAGGVDFYRYYKINYCPFCGEKINIEIDSVEDVTEKYNKIKEKRYNLRQMLRDCDSKSMERKLEEKIRELNKKIDYYFETDKWTVELDEYDYYD